MESMEKIKSVPPTFRAEDQEQIQSVPPTNRAEGQEAWATWKA
jgi:hypothetical protein